MPIDARIPLGATIPQIDSPQEAQAKSLQLQTASLGLRAKGQELKDQAQLRQILQQTGGDLEQAKPLIMQMNPRLGLEIEKELQGIHAAAQTFQQKRLELERDQADYLSQASDENDFGKRLITLKTAGFDVTAHAQQPWSPALKQSLTEAAMKPETRALRDIQAANQKSQEAVREAEIANKTADNERAERAEQRQHELALAQIQNIADDNKRQAARDAEIIRHNKADEATAGARERREAAGDTGVTLSPQGLDIAAENYAKTGQLPPMGMGRQGATVRSRIINRAAEMHPELDLASARAGFQANEGSLKALQKSRDAISAFENTALKNIDIFLKTAGKVVDTGSPLANTAARAISGRMLGSPDQAAYDAARQVALNEIAKIVSNPNLAGTLSDSARHEVEAFNPNSATLKQSVAVMRVLKQDMENRAQSYDAQIADIKARIKGEKKPETAAPTPAASGGLTYQEYLKSKGGK